MTLIPSERCAPTGEVTWSRPASAIAPWLMDDNLAPAAAAAVQVARPIPECPGDEDTLSCKGRASHAGGSDAIS